jgi:hypothetical protein
LVSVALESGFEVLSPWLLLTAAAVLLAAVASTAVVTAAASVVALLLAVVSTLGPAAGLESLRAALTRPSASTDCVMSLPWDDVEGGGEAAPL